MHWFDELLKYGKMSFHLVRKHKVILLPQVILILLKLFALLALFYLGVNIAEDFVESGRDPDFIFEHSLLPSLIFGGLGIGLLALIIKSYVDAGTSSLILLALKGKPISLADFWAGGNYFFVRILAGNLMLILGGIILSPLLIIIYILIGILTLGLGFIALPLIVSVFLGMWQTSLICNDTDIMTSLKNSVRFGQEYFWPFLCVNFIQGIITGFTSFNGGSGENKGLNYNVKLEDLDKIPSYFYKEGLSWLIGLGGAVFSVFFIFWSLLKILFDVFFKSFYLIMYLDKRGQL